jgi:hypothetical protein
MRDGPRAGVQKIEAALRESGDMDYNEAPLSEVADDIAAAHGINVVINNRASGRCRTGELGHAGHGPPVRPSRSIRV